MTRQFKLKVLKLARHLSHKGLRSFHKESRQLHNLFAQYEEPCPWCQMYRPGEEPNLVPTATPGSHGICPECFEIIKKKMLEKKKK